MTFASFAGLRRVHFVGIGGAGMCGIAELLRDYDLEVTGSDLKRSAATDRLERLGVEIFEGHDARHLGTADVVVYSSAVPPTNVEVAAARERSLPVVRRAEMLAELMRLKYGVAVAGTHGKTTTTSLIGHVLTETGRDPTVIVGGRLRVTGTGARHGKSELMVVEADEYDRSFLSLMPIVAVITNIDRDHLDTYRDIEDIKSAFLGFASRVPFFGRVVLCLDDPRILELLPRLSDRRVTSYGLSPQAELSAHALETSASGTRFTVRHLSEGALGEVELPIPGEHNVRNALAAIAVCRVLGLGLPEITGALASFEGIHRRFERKGVLFGAESGAAVVDDYAHHPTEVEATLEAARQVFSGRVLAVFQPHLYSRTRDLADEFGRALLLADRALVLDIYPSREQPIEGVTSELVVSAARRSGHRDVQWCRDWDEVPGLLHDAGPEDVVLSLGAGDVVRLAERLAEPLRAGPTLVGVEEGS
ncbi:MAG TPA: UDP-N-acetylmuramate--L-alanine ligase [Thermoanaerobaculia bacterium]|nr:UDP-N-acetylmuramate--L-alanine ligase [Thermoanaerobaculia bacterium]